MLLAKWHYNLHLGEATCGTRANCQVEANASELERNGAAVVEFTSYSGSFLEGIRKITSQDNRFLGRDLETGPPVAVPRRRP